MEKRYARQQKYDQEKGPHIEIRTEIARKYDQ